MVSPLRLSKFRRLLGAAFVSGFGDALIPIAFAIASHTVESSGWGLTAVMIALWGGRFVGMSLVQRRGPADNPIRTMIGSDLVRLLAQAGLLVWLVSGPEWTESTYSSIVAMAASSCIYGVATAFFQPARFTAIPRVVDKEMHATANSWLSILGDAFAVVGPLAGSAIVIWLGFESVLIIDSITFIMAIALLLGVKLDAHDSAVPEGSSDRMGRPAFRVPLPRWANIGFVTWFVVAFTIGLLGTAGPTLVIGKNSAEAWAVTAACMAVGSLVGSGSSLLGIAGRLKWRNLHLGACAALAVQVLCFLTLDWEVGIWIAGFIGSAMVTISGIRWDTLGQGFDSPDEVHAFASKDQVINTAGIPAGMVAFGASTIIGIEVSFVSILALVLFGSGVFAALLAKPQERTMTT